MHIEAMRTHRVSCGEELNMILSRHLPPLREQDLVVITSKIISLCQGRVVPKSTVGKKKLISQEADAVAVIESPYGVCLTLKNGMLLASAGIDESNSEEDMYILYPAAVQETAQAVWTFLREKYALSSLGVLITDSHTTPLRRGVVGICMGWCGFEPFYSYIGKPDIYGRPLRATQINLLDALATAAVLVMGEGDEQTPLALIRQAPKIIFLERPPTPEEVKQVTIPIEGDLYGPLFAGVSWIRKTD